MKNCLGQKQKISKITSTPATLSDQQLFLLCQKFGAQALEARKKFTGLLPEVFKRRLYEKKKFFSIYHFAAKLAGISKKQVDLALNLNKQFDDKPVLQKALTEGEISINKLARIASIATKENQNEILEKAKILPKSALDVWVKDVKFGMKKNDANGLANDTGENRDGLFEGKNKSKFLPGQKLELAEDVKKELFEMQKKGIDVNEFLREVLKERKKRIAEEKEELAKEQQKKSQDRAIIGAPASTYVSVKIQKIIQKEYGTKCSHPNCDRLAKNIHHTLPFSISQNHDPHFLAPLCEEHHKIAHLINVKYAEAARR